MTPLLTIMIPTVPERRVQRDRLEFEIWRQIEKDGLGDLVNVVLDSRGKEITIGEKRNDLYNHPDAGEYSWQIDDDDFIHPEALVLIIKALESKPDCVTYYESVNMDNVQKTCDHSIKYDKWQDCAYGFDYVRCPYFKDVIKTELCRAVTVEHLRWNEDEKFSMAIKPLLKTEAHILEEIYQYIYISSPHAERYGII